MNSSFRTDTGFSVPGCPVDKWESFLHELVGSNHLSYPTLAEAAAYSFAMVVRFALGLSAQEGRVTGFVTDSFAGQITLAALRHLAVGGSRVSVFKLGSPHTNSVEMDNALMAIMRRGGQVRHWICGTYWQEVQSLVEVSHNVLCGLSGAPSEFSSHLDTFAREINELPVPVHTVLAPTGINLHTGESSGVTQLYASSTLSLGLPFKALADCEEFVGRHYLGDLSWTEQMYRSGGYVGHPLFHEQPVIKLSAIAPTQTIESSHEGSSQ